MKRGVSNVVTSILLILIAIAAIIVAWGIIKGVIENTTGGVDLSSVVVSMEIEKANVQGTTAQVTIKRGSGEGEIDKIKIIFTNDAGQNYVNTTGVGLNILETKTFDVSNIPSTLNPTKIEIYPVFVRNNKEKIGILADSANVVGGSAPGCIDECTPSGSKVCVGNSWKLCGNFDADSCLEWSGLTPCTAPTSFCSAGTCVQCLTNADCAPPLVCDLTTKTCITAPIICTDADNDRYNVTADCGVIDCDDRINGADGIPGNADDGANIYPGATEICGDGIDQDCSGADLSCTGDITTRLISYWKLNGNANDEKTTNPGIWTGTETYTSDRNGIANNAAIFDGASYINAGNSLSLALTGNITLSAWFKWNGGSGAHTIAGKFDQQLDDDGYTIFILSNILYGRIVQSNDVIKQVTISFTDTTSWHHVALIHNSTHVNLYLDGSLRGITSTDGTMGVDGADYFLIGTAENYVGGVSNRKTHIFNGSIDEVRIYDRALSVTDINLLYTSL